MNLALWIVQVLLAVVLFAHGGMFLFPPAAIAEQMNAMLPRWFQLFPGVAEFAAAVGLTVPRLMRIQPRLVPMAGVGIMIVLLAATVLHVARNEVSSSVTTTVLLLMAMFVAHMRWRVKPIAAR